MTLCKKGPNEFIRWGLFYEGYNTTTRLEMDASHHLLHRNGLSR